MDISIEESRRLSDHVIVVYHRPFCGFCDSALRLLQRKGLPAHQVNAAGNRALRSWLREVTGQHTVPQIFIAGRSIGGYTELSRLESQGGLDALSVQPP